MLSFYYLYLTAYWTKQAHVLINSFSTDHKGHYRRSRVFRVLRHDFQLLRGVLKRSARSLSEQTTAHSLPREWRRRRFDRRVNGPIPYAGELPCPSPLLRSSAAFPQLLRADSTFLTLRPSTAQERDTETIPAEDSTDSYLP